MVRRTRCARTIRSGAALAQMMTPPRQLPPPYAHVAPRAFERGARGAMWLYEPEPFIHYTQATGFLERSTVAAIRDVGDDIYARGRRVWTVHDWADVEGYESAVRNLYVRWSFARREWLAGACVLARPGLVKMGVSVAAMTLSAAGVPISLFDERAPFILRFLEIARADRSARG